MYAEDMLAPASNPVHPARESWHPTQDEEAIGEEHRSPETPEPYGLGVLAPRPA